MDQGIEDGFTYAYAGVLRSTSSGDRTIGTSYRCTMSTRDDLASLPPATLRTALEASEKRIKGEKERIRKEIRELQKQLHELEEGRGTPVPEIGSQEVADTNVTTVSKGKRRRADSLDEDDWPEPEEKYTHRPLASVRRVDPAPVLPQRYVCGVFNEVLVIR